MAQPMTETAWLVEFTYHTGAPWYWTGRGFEDFTPDHSNALRFSRQEDAERVRVWLLEQPDNYTRPPRPNADKQLRSVQHLWSGTIRAERESAPPANPEALRMLRLIRDRLWNYSRSPQDANEQERYECAHEVDDVIIELEAEWPVAPSAVPASSPRTLGCRQCGRDFQYEPFTVTVEGTPAVTSFFCSIECRESWNLGRPASSPQEKK